MTSKQPIKATCHCGNLTITVPGQPELINECQCTICRSYGAAWGYYKISEAAWTIKDGGNFKEYARTSLGSNHIFRRCDHCGCVMCWWPSDTKDPGAECGINMRMVDPKKLEFVERRISYEDLLNGKE
ncbi:hypothetical protein LTR62_005961 [Meristemomyces frigidus]|uniref:CENP-V/GFA domain-containing protein n=1 Tax=Meristemomyces frigidus TaxID=1508187 RepID=A0AAN7TQR2_9PEZI|nr:hypothetical protein LTR62_005961 [Meristemomyces frigidus]